MKTAIESEVGKTPVKDPGGEPEEREPRSTPPQGRDPVPAEPQKDPPREPPNEPGAPLPMIQDPPGPDANPIDPRVFAST